MRLGPECATIPARTMGPSAAELAHQSRPVVLAVDDDSGVLQSLELILEEQYEVLVASDGSAALEVVRTRPIDAVLLDVLMPGLDGLEVLARMKAIDSSLGVILISALKDIELVVAGINLGA